MSVREPIHHRPLESVVVPTDFSRGADQAFRRALLLPYAQRAKLVLLSVLPAKLPAAVRTRAVTDARHELEERAERARTALRSRAVTVTTEVHEGEPFVEIIRRARQLHTELIVLGRHGRRPVRDMFISTTAERVVRKGDVPVLVVNLRPAHAYQSPLLATDLEEAAPRMIELALRVLGPTPGTVHVVHAFNVPFEGFVTPTRTGRKQSDYRKAMHDQAEAGLDKLLARFAGTGVKWRPILRAGDARSLILNEAAKREVDLITVGTHARSGVAHALVGSVAEWVIAAAPCDVLVTRPARFAFKAP
jgi:nucleotide-binding universal stress UspA family protein